jgi:hypothetical protein
VNAAACNDCHTNPPRDFTSSTQHVMTTQYLAGGAVFPFGPLASTFGVVRAMSADLLGSTHGFFAQPGTTFDVFLATITQGVHADEASRPPLAYPMPWPTFRKMTLGDLQSIYTYLRWLALNKPDGGAGFADKITQSAAFYCTGNNACNTGAGETCDMTNHECIGRPCATDDDCHVCQTCNGPDAGASDGGSDGGLCAAPLANSGCLVTGR